MHGLENRRTVRNLEVVTWAKDLVALFLAETWATEARLQRLGAKLKFDHCWIGPSAGKLGCLALFWKKSAFINVVFASPNHIDAVVGDSVLYQW